jgi:hypothetical protein
MLYSQEFTQQEVQDVVANQNDNTDLSTIKTRKHFWVGTANASTTQDETMAHSFNLWNFYQYSDYYEFDVTQAETWGLQAGTREWVAACLAAGGVDLAIRSWEITPGRAFYYSDYTHDTDWRDRWTRCWTVRVYADSEMLLTTNELSYAPLSVIESDSTWDEAAPDPRLDRSALLIIDYQADAAFVEQQCQAVLAQAALDNTDSHSEIRHYGEQLHQLRLRLVGELFPSHAKQLDSLIEHFKAGGGITNWRDRLTWQEKEPEITPEMQAWLDKLGGGSN